MNRLWQYWNSLPSQDQTAVTIRSGLTVVGAIILAVLLICSS
jgi:hypothetical protein